MEVIKQNAITFETEILGLKKSQKQFVLILGISIIIISFVFGLFLGIKDKKQLANAAHPFLVPVGNNLEIVKLSFDVARGASLVSMGQNVALNGRAAEVAMFTSERGVKVLIAEQRKIWEEMGLDVSGTATATRGVLFATRANSHQVFTMTAWQVPTAQYGSKYQGLVQGTIASADLEIAPIIPAESRGYVPEVPLVDGAQGGTVFSSKERNGRAVSSAYTLKMDVKEAYLRYRQEMIGQGWSSENNLQSFVAGDVASLGFTKDGRQLTLLFSKSSYDDPSDVSNKTVMTIILAPIA
jgi:hypothetical protein